jgi:hypothetical protein
VGSGSGEESSAESSAESAVKSDARVWATLMMPMLAFPGQSRTTTTCASVLMSRILIGTRPSRRVRMEEARMEEVRMEVGEKL